MPHVWSETVNFWKIGLKVSRHFVLDLFWLKDPHKDYYRKKG